MDNIYVYKPKVFIDTSYIFYKIAAVDKWCKLSNNTFSEELVKDKFIKALEKFAKKLKIEVRDMILPRDTRVENLWRTKLYPKYKQQRTYTTYGKCVQSLYVELIKYFDKVIKIEEAEADDIIAVLTFYFLENTKSDIYIITTDKDFYQLANQRVKIIHPKDFKAVDVSNFSLNEKIINGDNSDNIRKLKKNFTIDDYMRNKQLIDLTYTPRKIQDRIFRLDLFPVNQNVKPLSIQLGFACINTKLRQENIYCSRTIRLQTIEKMSVNELKSRALQNVKDLITLIEWNYKNGIRLMRMSSEMFPHKSNKRVEDYNFDFAIPYLVEAGDLARKYKQRLTFHPAQFNVIGTPDEKKFQSTLDDLQWHAEVLDLMGMDQDSVMVIHTGGVYGDKEETIKRWIRNYKRIPEFIRRRLVLENCEKCFNIEDVLRISKEVDIPVVFDTHHDVCYRQLKENKLNEVRKYIPDILESWIMRGIKPKFHISEQRENCRIGAHSDYVEIIPDYLLEIPEKYGIDIDIMIEAKMKEDAVIKLYDKYEILNPFLS